VVAANHPGFESPKQAGAATRDEPIHGYLVLASVFLGVTGSALLLLGRKARLPSPGALDAALLGLGTARLSRLITRDKVMRPLRAPFTVEQHEGPGEIKEQPKGSGLTRAAGELVTCPRCTAIWAASCLTITYFASPGVGRFVAMILSSSLVSDFVNRSLVLLNEAGSR